MNNAHLALAAALLTASAGTALADSAARTATRSASIETRVPHTTPTRGDGAPLAPLAPKAPAAARTPARVAPAADVQLDDRATAVYTPISYPAGYGAGIDLAGFIDRAQAVNVWIAPPANLVGFEQPAAMAEAARRTFGDVDGPLSF